MRLTPYHPLGVTQAAGSRAAVRASPPWRSWGQVSHPNHAPRLAPARLALGWRSTRHLLTGGIGWANRRRGRASRPRGAGRRRRHRRRKVVDPGDPTLARIAERFGPRLVGPDGALDRARLAAIVFPDPDALADLDRITGPAIAARVEEQRGAADVQAISVYDMPLLVERRLWPRERLTLVVGRTGDAGSGGSSSSAGCPGGRGRRIGRQATDEERRGAADVLVDNDGDLAATRAQVRPSGSSGSSLLREPARRTRARRPTCPHRPARPHLAGPRRPSRRPHRRRARRPGAASRAHRLHERPGAGGQGRHQPAGRCPLARRRGRPSLRRRSHSARVRTRTGAHRRHPTSGRG